MTYIQFQVKIPPQMIVPIEEALGGIAESMWWDEEGNTAGIILEENKIELENCLSSLLEAPLDIRFSPMDSRDWLAIDQEQLGALEAGPFFLYPPHFAGPVPKDKLSLKIDSPYAFGSGHHETTKSCLLAMSEIAEKQKISKALDIGCGSGILAMGIALLWEAHVCATDCDPLSVAAALKNVQENGLSNIQVVECFGLDHELIADEAPFDLIVANIHSAPLIELAPAIKRSIVKSGSVILSGILREQEEAVALAYKNEGFQCEKRYREGQWSTLLFIRHEI